MRSGTVRVSACQRAAPARLARATLFSWALRQKPTDDVKVESRDGGASTGHIAHSYIMWDTFKINFYSSLEALEASRAPPRAVEEEAPAAAASDSSAVGAATVLEVGESIEF